MARRTLGTIRQIEMIARVKLDGGCAFVFVRGVGIWLCSSVVCSFGVLNRPLGFSPALTEVHGSFLDDVGGHFIGPLRSIFK